MKTNDNPEKNEIILQTIFNTMSEGVVLLNSNGKILQANDSAKKILGLIDSENEGGKYDLPGWQKIRPDGTPMPFEEMAIHRATTEKQSITNEVMGLRKQDHSISWINVSAVPIISHEGTIEHVIGTFTDITEKKNVEDALSLAKQKKVNEQNEQAKKAIIESEERYRSLFEFMEEGFLRADSKGKIIMANMAIARMCGYDSPDEMIGLHMSKLYANPTQRDLVLRKTVQKGVVHNYELMLRDKEGNSFWTLSNIKVLKNEKNEIVGTEGLIRDITTRKKAEDALRESEEKFRQIYEHMSVGIAKVNLDFRIEGANESYCQMLGYTEDQLIGKHLKDITAPETLQENLVKQSQLATGKIDYFRMEKSFIHKNGRVIEGILDSNLVRDAHGKPIYFLGSVLDVTDRNQLEKQVQQSQKIEAIGTLAGGIAHDFNNILNVFTGNISYALSFLKEDDEMFDVLSELMTGAKQAENLTHQLLTFAKGGEPIKKLCNINTIVEKAALFVTSGAKSKCKFDLANNLWVAEVDPGQLNQVISNVVINADQSMPNGGIINIRSKNTVIEKDSIFPLSPGNYVQILIKDKGMGIKESHLSAIFDPYFTTKKKGNGLGLTTSYSIIERHKGHISVDSEMNAGSVFCIFLPASKDNYIETPVIQENTIKKGHGKILVMDDQEPILKMIARMLKRMGYEAELAKDGDQAIGIYKKSFQSQHPFDLVILDLTIPGGKGGAETMAELLKIDPNVKAIVSSGYSNDPIMANFKEYGFCGVVPKPYTKNELSEILNKI